MASKERRFYSVFTFVAIGKKPEKVQNPKSKFFIYFCLLLFWGIFGAHMKNLKSAQNTVLMLKVITLATFANYECQANAKKTENFQTFLKSKKTFLSKSTILKLSLKCLKQ
jgi:hypothetical protein